MKPPIEDTIWGSHYGSTAAVQAAFDRIGPVYHEAIIASGVPSGAALALLPHLDPEAQGIDFGCGSGVLGLALREAGLRRPLDGIDLSPGMLTLAKKSGCYRHLQRGNLLLPEAYSALKGPYDFAVTVGLIGDYVPHYLALPHIVSILKPEAILGFAVERRSTQQRALEEQVKKLGLVLLSETILAVPQGTLEEQSYHFFAMRLPATLPA